MKNITVSVDDDTYRRARVKAAELDTSVSSLVREFLSKFAEEESEIQRLKRDEARLRATIVRFRASDRMDRDTLHRRGH